MTKKIKITDLPASKKAKNVKGGRLYGGGDTKLSNDASKQRKGGNSKIEI